MGMFDFLINSKKAKVGIEYIYLSNTACRWTENQSNMGQLW
jgi:hypothetical protein